MTESAARGFALVLFQASCWSGADDDEIHRLFHDARRRGLAALAPDPAFCAELEASSIPDDGHPTAQGHQLLARRLAPLVRAALERRAMPPPP